MDENASGSGGLRNRSEPVSRQRQIWFNHMSNSRIDAKKTSIANVCLRIASARKVLGSRWMLLIWRETKLTRPGSSSFVHTQSFFHQYDSVQSRSLGRIEIPTLRNLASSFPVVLLNFGAVAIDMLEGLHLEIAELFVERYDCPFERRVPGGRILERLFESCSLDLVSLSCFGCRPAIHRTVFDQSLMLIAIGAFIFVVVCSLTRCW